MVTSSASYQKLSWTPSEGLLSVAHLSLTLVSLMKELSGKVMDSHQSLCGSDHENVSYFLIHFQHWANNLKHDTSKMLHTSTHGQQQVKEVSFLFAFTTSRRHHWFCSWTSLGMTCALNPRAEALFHKNENSFSAWFISLSIVVSNSIEIPGTKSSCILYFRTKRRKDLQYHYHKESVNLWGRKVDYPDIFCPVDGRHRYGITEPRNMYNYYL